MFDSRFLIPVLAIAVSACAPDAVNNRAATGFDGFLNQIQRSCAPLQYGRYQFADPLMGTASGNSYDYWLDQTSKLYYRRVGPDAYAESLNAFFGAGNQDSISCTLRYLPPG
ncbi:MAG: hypothetical protein ABI777_03755 [Betaproteobacteria bacterium]